MAEAQVMRTEEENEKVYACQHCHEEISWESGHDKKGNVWGCEECGGSFCSACFMEHTKEGYPPGTEIYEQVLCPDCFTEENIVKENK